MKNKSRVLLKVLMDMIPDKDDKIRAVDIVQQIIDDIEENKPKSEGNNN